MNELKQLQRQINSNVNKIKLFTSTPYLVSKNKDQLYVLQTNVNNDLKKFKKDTKKYLESIFKTKYEYIKIPKTKKIKCVVKGTYFKDIKDLKLKSLSNTDINKLVENIDLSKARFYNEYNYGSYMLFRGIPVFIDSRADLYAPEFSGDKDKDIFTDFINTSSISKFYEETFEKYDINYVILLKKSKTNMIITKAHDENYKELYSDDNFVIYQRLNANK